MDYLGKLYDGLEKHGGTRDITKYTKSYGYVEAEGRYCCCGHAIRRVYTVKNIHTDVEVEIGSCCIKKFGIKRLCVECRQEHRNRKDMLCNNCRRAAYEKEKQDARWKAAWKECDRLMKKA